VFAPKTATFKAGEESGRAKERARIIAVLKSQVQECCGKANRDYLPKCRATLGIIESLEKEG
jgi:hypothetical protein